MVVFEKVFGPMLGIPVTQAAVEEATEIRAKGFSQLEAWLTATPYLTGSEITIADLSALCEVTGHRLVDFDLTPYPHVQAWVTRMFETPAVAESHQALMELKAQLDAKRQEAAKEA